MDSISIGIGCIPTSEQNAQHLIDAFKKEGISERYIFIDDNPNTRLEYKKARTIVRQGDTVYLYALDALGQSIREIEQEWRFFTEEIGCYMVVINMPLLDTRSSYGSTDIGERTSKLVSSIFSWMLQHESNERRRRQREGIEIAKLEGKYKGRKPISVDKNMFSQLFAEVERGERTNKYVMDKLKLTRSTYYKLVDEYKQKNGRFAE